MWLHVQMDAGVFGCWCWLLLLRHGSGTHRRSVLAAPGSHPTEQHYPQGSQGWHRQRVRLWTLCERTTVEDIAARRIQSLVARCFAPISARVTKERPQCPSNSTLRNTELPRLCVHTFHSSLLALRSRFCCVALHNHSALALLIRD